MRRVAILAATALMAAIAALPADATTPEPPNGIIPAHVNVVGFGPGGPDTQTGQVTVIVRDLANNPIPGVQIAFDFSGCPDVSIATDQHDPALAVNCGFRHVTGITGADGSAALTIVGGGTSAPAGPPQALSIYGDGVFLGRVSVGVLDRDGVGGLSGQDLSLWVTDLFALTNPPRSDYNGDGNVGALDLSVWAAAYFNGHNTESASSYCP